ncbi:ABC transporter substrate-binding protein [Corynebacterium propinquum]|uniref:peptide ABC transporter substrate-binding protein n=1 Tax=Corynebacterium propinquum TaxID=43769 RepID=UPI00036A68B1|nr:ABC transporter substrate-binding protein [Corynebacterium propinquum]QQU90630.1 ABC transporter substrate-binding protein [Corynebacterium propinquum]WKS49092.1 ABC transporter substrate-binding protein [Corynebacterium propinquum]
MKMTKSIGVLAAAGLSLTLVACSDDSGSSSAGGSAEGGTNYVLANLTEPQNPLVPGNTNEAGGGTAIQFLYSGLTYYDAEGESHNDLAESIDFDGDRTYTVKLKDAKWEDGTPITANDFVDAWNYTVSESLLQESFFTLIKGYAEGAESMEGLTVEDDKTFTIELSEPTADFEQRLGYGPFKPLHPSAFDDIDAYGEKPIANGPYKLVEWNHNENILLVPNEEYEGDRKAQNDGVDFRIYTQQDAAYADLLSGNLDVIDSIPESALSQFEDELGDRAVSQPSAVFQAFTIPSKLEHFEGEEGKLRRQAISLAFDREEISKTIFRDTVTPAKDFTSPVIPGYEEDLEGNEVLEFDPEKAKELWEQADDISEFNGTFEIAYNADGGHQAWVDALTNQLSNNLDIDAIGNPYPDFKGLRDDITSGSIDTAFRSGWQADYPSLGNFLEPNFATGGSSNDGKYSSEEFDAKLAEAQQAESVEEATKLYSEAQKILFKDLPAIPMWYSNAAAGYSEAVENVEFAWNRIPVFYAITKS